MPKIPISHLNCAESFEDGKIEVRYFGQFNTDLHYHEQTQLISPEMGIVYLYSEYGSYCVPANHYIYVAANVQHRLISRSHNLKLKTIFLNLTNEITGINDKEMVKIFSPNELLDNLLNFGVQHWNTHQNNDLRASGLDSLKRMLPYLLTKPIQFHTRAPQSERLLRLVEFIMDTLAENLTIDLISEKAEMPQRTLFRLFKKETGMTLFQFIKFSRMQKAIELMEDPSLSISEIVYKIGYESIATFSNTFKKLVGISPKKYRQRVFK